MQIGGNQLQEGVVNWELDGDNNLYTGSGNSFLNSASYNQVSGVNNTVDGAVDNNFVHGLDNTLEAYPLSGSVSNNQLFGYYSKFSSKGGATGYNVLYNFIGGGRGHEVGALNGVTLFDSTDNFVGGGYGTFLKGTARSASLGGQYNYTVEGKGGSILDSVFIGGYNNGISPGPTGNTQFVNIIGTDSFAANDTFNNSVIMPKLFIGRGLNGALPYNATPAFMLGYNNTTGAVERSPVPGGGGSGWPLSGTADLTGNVIITGGGSYYNVELGTVANQLGVFNVSAYSNSTIYTYNNLRVEGYNQLLLYSQAKSILSSYGDVAIYTYNGGQYGSIGDVLTSNGTNVYWAAPASDEKLKLITGGILGATDMIRQMNPITFEWDRNKWNQGQDGSIFGFSAQNLQNINAGLVAEFDNKGETYLKISGSDQILAIVAQAVKEIDERVSVLERT